MKENVKILCIGLSTIALFALIGWVFILFPPLAFVPPILGLAFVLGSAINDSYKKRKK